MSDDSGKTQPSPDRPGLADIAPLAGSPAVPEPASMDLHMSLTQAQATERHRDWMENQRANRALRQNAAERAYWYLCALSIAVFFILLLAGFRIGGFALDSVVLTTLAGGTFVSAMGLVGLVIKGLFPLPPAEPADRAAKTD